MEITINVLTGNHFLDGTPEIGTEQTYNVKTRVDLEEIMEQYDEDFFITTEENKIISVYDLMCMLD